MPFWITATGNCLNFVDVQLLIHSTCESGDTYQYGVTTDNGEVAVDYTTVNSMASSTATFSVSWKAPAGILTDTASSSDEATKTSGNFNEIRVFGIILMISQIITILFISAGLWKMFNILNAVDQVPREKVLHDFYESKPEDIQGVNERFTTNSPNSRKLTVLSPENPSGVNDLHISIKRNEKKSSKNRLV